MQPSLSILLFQGISAKFNLPGWILATMHCKSWQDQTTEKSFNLHNSKSASHQFFSLFCFRWAPFKSIKGSFAKRPFEEWSDWNTRTTGLRIALFGNNRSVLKMQFVDPGVDGWSVFNDQWPREAFDQSLKFGWWSNPDNWSDPDNFARSSR